MRVATYNLYLGADLSLLFGVGPERLDGAVATLLAQLEVTDFPTRARMLAEVIESSHADLVGLQEVTTWSRDGQVICDFLAELTAALAEQGASYAVHAVTANFSGEGAGMRVVGHNAILVRSGVEVEDEATDDFAEALTVPTPLGDVRIARSWGWVDVQVSGMRVRFANTHTEAYDEQVRNAQRDELLAAIGDPGNAVVLVGDFNAEPDYVGMPATYVDAWVAAGEGEAATCCQAADLRNETSELTQRIDYIWVRDLEVQRCRRLGADQTGPWPSDHAGVIAELA